jgi:RNA polymerase sigma factor (sigma-70 family)
MNLSLEQRNTLILQYMPLASKIAANKKKHLYSVDIDELRAAAYLGLVEAVDRYDPNHEKYFSCILIRIVGAIKDYLRSLGFGSKGSISRGCSGFKSLDLNLNLESKNTTDLQVVFDEMTEALSQQGRSLLWQYFVEGRKMKEIAGAMGLAESRISQLIGMYCQQIEFA